MAIYFDEVKQNSRDIKVCITTAKVPIRNQLQMVPVGMMYYAKWQG